MLFGLSVLLLIFSIFLLSRSAFRWGYYSSQSMHSTAMIHHHERMIKIFDEDRMPTFHEVTMSLEEVRRECRRDPSFKKDFLGKDEA